MELNLHYSVVIEILTAKIRCSVTKKKKSGVLSSSFTVHLFPMEFVVLFGFYDCYML